ncbi:MAG: hypothetical protein R3C12_10770 [Planctomycetaceae bacterium]|nr:hypothetical protein [Planctomycetaceae bacterium]
MGSSDFKGKSKREKSGIVDSHDIRCHYVWKPWGDVSSRGVLGVEDVRLATARFFPCRVNLFWKMRRS